LFAGRVTGNCCRLLGVRAQRGRVLLPSDEIAAGQNPVIVLSDGVWRRDYDADPAIVGKTTEINSFPLTIVGVADATFHGTTVVYDVEAYIPVTMAPSLGFNFGSRETTASGILSDRRAPFTFPQGFLRPGATLASASAQSDTLWAAQAGERPMADVSERLKTVVFWKTPDGAPM